MSTLFYVVINFNDDQASHAAHAALSGQCIMVLHGFIMDRQLNNIGTCFPKWSQSSVGPCIAFVSDDKCVLEDLISRKRFLIMCEYATINLSDVLPVKSVRRQVKFIRNQSIGKFFSGDKRRRYKRRDARAAANGKIFNHYSAPEKKEIGHFHTIPVISGSKQEEFVLFVQCIEITEEDQFFSEYCSYGLATNEKFKGSVPLIDVD